MDMRMNVAAGEIAVCILFYEKVDQTIECIKSFLPSGVKIYVLNNSSSESARAMLGEFAKPYPNVIIIDSPVNLGVGMGRNLLIQYTHEPWLFFVDNDITVKNTDWVDKVRGYLSQFPTVEAFIPRLYNLHEEQYVSFFEIKLFDKEIKTVPVEGQYSNNFPGGAAIVSREVFNRLGEYDKDMFIGLEDFELAIRGVIYNQPIIALHTPDIELVHDHQIVTRFEDVNAVQVRYDEDKIQRSFDRLIAKHGVAFEHEWRDWVSDQKKMMIQTSWMEETSLGITWVKKTIKRLLASKRKPANPLRRQPTSCTLFMTDVCNFSCAGCSRTIVGLPHGQEMSLDIVKQILVKYPSINGFCVAGLGEPTLCGEFVEIIDYLKQKKKFVGVITNGSNQEVFERLKSKPDYISISLYGCDAESYQQYCGVPAFPTVIATFQKLKEAKISTGFSYIVNMQNYPSLQQVLNLCDQLQPDFLNLLNYLVYDPGLREEREKVITTFDGDVISHINELVSERKYVSLKPTYINPSEMRQNCQSYNEIINVDGEGNIGGCQRQIHPAAKYGNIFTDDDPFNSTEMLAIRKKMACNCYPHMECRFCFGNWIR